MPTDNTVRRVGGFKETAEYFEARARRAHNETDHEHLMGAARFYREVAAIIRALPAGFSPPRDVNRANRDRNRAEMCRAIADLLADARCKQRLEDLATTYDVLAASCETCKADAAIRPSGTMRRATARLYGRGDVLPR